MLTDQALPLKAGQEPPPRPSPMRRELPPTPAKLPAAHDSASYGTGDARVMAERRMWERKADRFLRDRGMNAAWRDYVLETGRRTRAAHAEMAQDTAAGTLDDFAAFCPGAAKLEVLTPTTRERSLADKSPKSNPKLAEDAVITDLYFNPMTNALEQRQLTRAEFMKLKRGA